jgi:hypothetical protein
VGDGDVKLIDFENYDVGRPIEDYVNMAFFFPQKMRQEVFRDERCRAIALMYLDKIIAFYFTCTDARKHKDLFDEFLRDYRTVAYLSVPSLRRYDV